MFRLVPLVLFACTLVGCAQQRIRDHSTDLLRGANYEAAIAALESGVKDHPDSTLLRSGLLQARAEALTALIGRAAGERARGQLDLAESTLKRAIRFDTSGGRVQTLLDDIAIERRQVGALSRARQLADSGQPGPALSIINDALKDNPRNGDLVGLRRKLEAESRQNQLRSARTGLAESRPVSIDFRDANLRSVLDMVTRGSGINFVIDKDVRQDLRVTVHLRSVSVADAIDLIVSTHQLAMKIVDPRTVLIYPNTAEKRREHQEQVLRVFQLTSGDVKAAAAFLKSMLNVREPFIDERTNLLALRETPENIELAERLIGILDAAEPEVLLELEVIEVRRSRLTDLGVQFPNTLSLTPLSPSGSAGGLTLGNVQGINSDRIGLGIGGILVNLRREVGDFNTLANPRIRTRNRQKAQVLIGDKVPVVTATTGQGGFVSDSVSYLDVGLKLDVEPTVYADDEVGIRVALEVSSVAREVRTASGTLAYQIGTRNASTLLRLKDGETQLLAGLISDDDRSSANRVPGLGDLPIAGRLFSSQRDESQRTELVLAVTPRVLRNVQRLDAAQSEFWIGTEAYQRLRPAGGQLVTSAMAPPASVAQPAMTMLAPAKPEARLSWTAPVNARVGDTFDVTVNLASTVSLLEAPFRMIFDRQLLEVITVEEGPAMRSEGATTSFTHAIDASQGVVRASVSRSASGASPAEAGVSGVILRMRVRALKPGSAEVSVQSARLQTTDGQALAPGTIPRLIVEVAP